MASKREYWLDLTFDGEIAKDFKQFWHHYELMAHQNVAVKLWSAKDDAPKLIAIEKQLRGKAALFVHRLPEGSKATVTALHEALTKKYVNPRAIQSYALAFDQATQQPREELDDFLRRLQRMVRLGFPNSTENDARVTRRFISGINSDTVRFRLLEKGFYKQDGTCEVPETVLVAAQELSSILQTSGDTPSICAIREENSVLRQKLTELEKKVDDLQVNANNKSGRSSRGRFPGRSRSIRCWYPPCGKQHPGGWKECRLRKRNEPEWQPSLTPNNRIPLASRAVQGQDSADDSNYLN